MDTSNSVVNAAVQLQEPEPPSRKTQLEQLHAQVEAAFAQLYSVDVATLTAAEKVDHAMALSAAYTALVKLENANLADLAQLQSDRLEVLRGAVENLNADLRRAARVADWLDKAGSIVKTMGAVAALV